MTVGDVLFPTDFSAASERAGLVARDMARQQGVRLHVIHVVPPVTDPEDSSEKLRRLAAELAKDLRVESALLSGRVAHQIIRYARDKRVGLIVLGTHGRTGVSRVLLGSVAEGVVRLAPCPVLTVPASAIEVEEPRPAPTEALAVHRCIVCAQESEDLICETCRTRIRGEVLEQKREAERPGRRGSPM
jgi:nucleotide-binding universal stress UspA family protein